MANTATERLGSKMRTFKKTLQPDERQALAELGALAEVGASLRTVLDAMHATLELHMSINSQLLQLMDEMQTESRKYSIISNILKAKRDEIKPIVDNMR